MKQIRKAQAPSFDLSPIRLPRASTPVVEEDRDIIPETRGNRGPQANESKMEPDSTEDFKDPQNISLGMDKTAITSYKEVILGYPMKGPAEADPLEEGQTWDSVFELLPVDILVNRTLSKMRQIAEKLSNGTATDAERRALTQFRNSCYNI